LVAFRAGSVPFIVSVTLLAVVTKTTPESAHEYSRLGTVESLVERGTYRLDESIFIDTLDKIYRDGHYYSHQTPLLATLTTPVYAALRWPGVKFNNRGRLLATYLFSLFTNGIALALTALVLSSVLALGGVSAPWRNVLAVLLPFATWLLPYGIVANNHGIAGFLLALVAWLLLFVEWHGLTPNRIRVLGGALGLVAAIELLPLVSFVPLTIGWLLTRRDMTARRWRDFLLLLAAPMAVQSAINIGITGDVIPAGFHHELFNYPGSAFTAEALTGTVKHDSTGELLRYAWTALFPGRGYFVLAPILLLASLAGVVEWRWWARARGAHAVLLGGVMLSLVASLLTTNHYGGGAVGFRHATYLAPALLIMLLPWLSDRETRRSQFAIVVVVSAISAASMVVLAVPRPWSPLTIDSAAIGSADEYMPLPSKFVRGTLLSP
jgi:Glycosyltransferase family 87